MAQVVLKKYVSDAGLVGQICVESAGTHASREGERADARAEASLARRGYDVGRFRSRRVSPTDFDRYDWILAMDSENLSALRAMCPSEHINKIRLYLNHSSNDSTKSVPDPYYGNAQGFERVLDLCEVGARGWVDRLR